MDENNMRVEDFTTREDGVRFIEVGANKLIVQRRDPYGFWDVHYERGPVPDSLSGHYTSFLEAMEAISNYLKVKDREPSETPAVVLPPVPTIESSPNPEPTLTANDSST